MSDIDLFSCVLLAVGLLLAFLTFFVMRQGKLMVKNWSRVIPFALGIFMFFSLLIGGWLFFPKTDLLSHISTSFFLSLVMGILAWIVFGIINWLWKRR